MATGRRHLTLAVVAIAGLAGCGLVPRQPAAPGIAPETVAMPVTTESGPLSQPAAPSPPPRTSPASPPHSTVAIRGFTAFERAALRVRNEGCGGLFIGSGFAISDHAFITNRHVVGGANVLEVSTFDGHDLHVTTAGAALVADLAIVRTLERLPTPVRLAGENPSPGAAVTAVGYPLGGPLKTSRGHVLGYGRDLIGLSRLPMLINDAPIQHGSSGSPLFNASGQLVGVAYAGKEGGPYYAVPVGVLNSLLADTDSFATSAPCD